MGKKDKDSRGLKIFKDAYNEVSINTGKMVKVHSDGPEVKAVLRKDLGAEFRKRMTTDEEDDASSAAKQKAFARAFQDAVARWGIHEGTWGGGQWVWRFEPVGGASDEILKKGPDIGHRTFSLGRMSVCPDRHVFLSVRSDICPV